MGRFLLYRFLVWEFEYREDLLIEIRDSVWFWGVDFEVLEGCVGRIVK